MLDVWIWAVGAIVVGIASGFVGGALLRTALLKGREDQLEIRDAARASAILVFLFFLATGLVVAVGVTSPENLRPIPARLLAYLPRVLAAGLILVAGRAIALAASGVVSRGLPDSPARVQNQAIQLLRLLVMAGAVVLALGQLGVDTSVLLVAVSAVLFGAAAAFALLVGLGGREISGELAAGRYLRRILVVGQRIEVGDTVGEITAVNPASVAVVLDDGATVHLPNTYVFRHLPRIEGGANG